jgi:MFS family permease
VAATGGFLFGYDTAVINGTVGALERHFSADPGRLGFAVAAALLGSAVGALVAGRVADLAGRVRAMRLTALLFASSSLGSGIAQSLWAFSAWRFLGGIAVGAGVAYGLYTAAAAVSIVFVARLVSETKGRALEEM